MLKIDLNIENNTHHKIPAQKQIKQVISEVFKNKKIDIKAIIGLKIVSKDEIQKYNQKYRHLDQPTDVLSFPIYEHPPKKTDKPILLGDIIICPDCAQDNILFLVAHATKHLLGYHHK